MFIKMGDNAASRLNLDMIIDYAPIVFEDGPGIQVAVIDNPKGISYIYASDAKRDIALDKLDLKLL